MDGAGDEAAVPMQPAAELDVRREVGRFAGQIGENGLNDVFGAMSVAGGAADRDGIDEIDVPFDEFAKGCFGPLLRVIPQKLIAFIHSAFTTYEAARCGNPTWMI